MSALLAALDFWITCNARSRDAVVDRRTNQPPVLWAGNPVRMRCAVFAGSDLVTDFANISRANFILRDGDVHGDALLSQAVLVAGFSALTLQDWQAFAGSHFHFAFTAPLLAEPLLEAPLYFAVELETTADDPVTVATGAAALRTPGGIDPTP